MPNVNEGKKRELGMPLQAQIYKLVLKIEVFISRTEGRQKETLKKNAVWSLLQVSQDGFTGPRVT